MKKYKDLKRNLFFLLNIQTNLNQYINQVDNLPFIKGKIINSDNFKLNHSNKAKFFCEYDEYSINMVLNKLIKSTLIKLNRISRSHFNRIKIQKLLHNFSLVHESSDIETDLIEAKTLNRLFSNYKKSLLWSEVFLKNKSFTNFSGTSNNTAILFPMERIFEDYIGSLMKKYVNTHKIKLHDKSYYLVSKHNHKHKFRLIPDIVATNKLNEEQIIFDTKWKLIDENKEKYNYNITQSDMYQLYAYGKKYSLNHSQKSEPNLVLIYPENPTFKDPLASFRYDGELDLKVVPFNLESCLSLEGERSELQKLFNRLEITNTFLT